MKKSGLRRFFCVSISIVALTITHNHTLHIHMVRVQLQILHPCQNQTDQDSSLFAPVSA